MSKINNKYFVYQARIFDGYKLIKLSLHKNFPDYLGNCQYLPNEFNVIENNVPIDYWSKADHTYIQEHMIIYNKFYNDYYNHRNPFDFDIVRVNTKLVIDQCLDNIKFECIPNKYISMYTVFSFNNITYRIIYYKYNFNVKYPDLMFYDEESFKKILLDDETLFTISQDKNTLNVRLI